MKKLPLLLMMFLIPFMGVLAQNRQITGTVTGDDGHPVIGAAVVVQGTNKGTITDIQGKYTIEVEDSDILVFTSIGYTEAVQAVQGRTTVDVVLTVDIEVLDEVVVIGYGTVKKSDLTGSVSSLKDEALTAGANVNVDQMLMGRAAGVQVYQNSAEPGGGLSVQIRGAGSVNASNEPLYVIDGLPIENSAAVTGTGSGMPGNRNPRNPLNSLNPSDIESIEVLKDASSTAIYGARGANGVILITTKKGSNSGKVQINYDGYYGMQKIAKKLDVLSAQEYQTVLNELYDAGAVNAGVGERVGEIQSGGTDWQDEIFRNAPIQNHNLSINGGDSNTRFYSSFNYYNQEGTVIESGMERYTARINIEEQSSKRFKFGANMNASYINDDYVANGVVPNESGGAVSAAFDFDPTLSIFDADGRYQTSPFITKDNPLAIAYGKESIAKSFRMFGTVYADYMIAEGLTARVNAGGDFSHTRKDVFVDDKTKDGLAANGIATVINGNRYNYLAEGTLNYNKVFRDVHSISAVAGITTQKFFLDRATAEARDFVSLSTGTNSLQSGNPEQYDVSSSSSGSTLLSYLGRANYSYNSKYLFTVTFRADGSSKFGANNKFAYFPSGAIAWKLSEEDFIKNLGIFSDLKFRGSWGKTGNQEIGNYRSLTTFSTGSNQLVIGENLYTVTNPTRMANPNLKWETTTQTDIGIDWGILKGRINGSIDYFQRKTEDLLLSVPVPAQTGFTTMLDNVGSVENSGFEFLIDSRNLTGKFQWFTSLNFTYLRNQVTDLGPVDQIIHGGVQFADNIAIITPGEALDSYYGWNILGVWQENDDYTNAPAGVQAGDWKYEDLNEDGSITADDRTILGDCIPDFTWGFTNTFSYAGFDLTFYLSGVHGVNLMNNQLKDALYPINFRRNKLAEPYLNRWTPENPTNEWSSLLNPSSQGSNVVNSRTVEDASYIRLQNITLSYNVPVKNNKVFSNLQVYLTGTNIFTLTNYSGMDPSANVNGTDNAALRMDYNSYPFSRVYSVGIKAGF